MSLKLQNTTGGNYGPIPAEYQFEVPDGYCVLIGKNNAGKSSFLQLIFRELFKANTVGVDKIALIPADRPYVRNSTHTPHEFKQYNHNVWDAINKNPRTYGNQQVIDSDALYSFLLHRTSFVGQINEINKYLVRLGFDEIVLRGTQVALIRDVHIVSQGAGLRSVLPILAALTSADIRFVLIDEPELALEARAQKVLREIFIEAAESGKTVVVATQSHIFLYKQDPSKNFIVENKDGTSSLSHIRDKQELMGVTYNLLGNSLEDLFFPSNFLIVEGSSDQVIFEKVAQLIAVPADRVKVIAARGIDSVQDSLKAICNTLIPLVAGESPYAKKVVVVADNPPQTSFPAFDRLKLRLQDRCILLSENSIEEHLSVDLYKKAGLEKAKVLAKISDLKDAIRYGQGGAHKQLADYKRLVSNAVASGLTQEDLPLMKTIVGAVKLAEALANT